MADRGFSAKTFFDRDAERSKFDEFLDVRDEARVLLIRDRGGIGKSHLLKRLHHRCLWEREPTVPAGLIVLDQLQDATRFGVVKELAEHLMDAELPLENYNALNEARLKRDLLAIRDVEHEIGYGDFRGAEILEGGRAAGTIIEKIEAKGDVYFGDWGAEFEDYARTRCVRAFFDDLAEVSRKQPVVILIDAWEKCPEQIGLFMRKRVLRRLVEDVTSYAGLLLVVAGRDVPDIELSSILSDQYPRITHVADGLTPWEERHVKDFLKSRGHPNVDGDTIEFLTKKLARDFSIEAAERLLETVVREATPEGLR